MFLYLQLLTFLFPTNYASLYYALTTILLFRKHCVGVWFRWPTEP